MIDQDVFFTDLQPNGKQFHVLDHIAVIENCELFTHEGIPHIDINSCTGNISIKQVVNKDRI